VFVQKTASFMSRKSQMEQSGVLTRTCAAASKFRRLVHFPTFVVPSMDHGPRARVFHTDKRGMNCCIGHMITTELLSQLLRSVIAW
jgi:hypothetical protein